MKIKLATFESHKDEIFQVNKIILKRILIEYLGTMVTSK
jgi:hypothetical protein